MRVRAKLDPIASQFAVPSLWNFCASTIHVPATRSIRVRVNVRVRVRVW